MNVALLIAGIGIATLALALILAGIGAIQMPESLVTGLTGVVVALVSLGTRAERQQARQPCQKCGHDPCSCHRTIGALIIGALLTAAAMPAAACGSAKTERVFSDLGSCLARCATSCGSDTIGSLLDGISADGERCTPPPKIAPERTDTGISGPKEQ